MDRVAELRDAPDPGRPVAFVSVGARITVAAAWLVVGFLVSLAATHVVVRPHGASSLTSPAGASVGAAVAVVGMGYSVSRLRVVVDPIGLRICNAMRSWPS